MSGNSHKIKSQLLKFALVDMDGEDNKELYNFCVEKIKVATGFSFTTSQGKKIKWAIMSSYQKGSGPQSLGRHLLTSIVKDALEINREESTVETNEMQRKKEEYKGVIDSIKSNYSKQYEEAVDEIKYIADTTQKNVKNSRKQNEEIYRRLSLSEKQHPFSGGIAKISTNILSSYSMDKNLSGYSTQHSSKKVLIRNLPTEQVIIHSYYYQIEEYGDEEKEIIIFNPEEYTVVKEDKIKDLEDLK